jgi:hypothetical protein
MKFGVREICNVVFKAKGDVKIGSTTFHRGEPVLYIDTAKTSTLEGAATTVYATGGRGNARLLAWEGEKTLTFTVEDAMLSPIGFAILSGAGLFKGSEDQPTVHVHTTSIAPVADGVIDVNQIIGKDEQICETAKIYAIPMENEEVIGAPVECSLTEDSKISVGEAFGASIAFVDFYLVKKAEKVAELQIDAETFAGYYYVEADCLFKRKSDGYDMPATLTIPKVKIQSNFTFNMAATGDPSTFTFTMDAMPDYTFFNTTRKVLCAVQIIEDAVIDSNGIAGSSSVFAHADAEDFE